MYVTITSTADGATDLGFLLHKHPGRAQSFEVSAGTAHVFYPEATEQRCAAALLLEVDPTDQERDRASALMAERARIARVPRAHQLGGCGDRHVGAP